MTAKAQYGSVAAESRRRAPPMEAAEVRALLVVNPTALRRLRRILDSGAREDDPLVYDVRPPVGSLPLYRWGCIEIRDVDGHVHVWPLPLAREVLP